MELGILKDIVIIFALSTGVNLIFTKIKVPTIVGYLFTGIVAGPHFLSLIGAQHEIELMAEIGVVLLMFTIGMEFSLNHIIKIRKVVFLGGIMQVGLTALVFFLVSKAYHVDNSGAIFIGFLTALSSTAIVLKLLQEKSELTSNYGRTVLGILIFQDIMLVPLILATQMLGDNSMDMESEVYKLIAKALLVLVFVFIGYRYVIPRLLHVIALTKNQELFMMSILLICSGVALLTSKMGMSLAFGAFLAGLMISESEYSHNAFGNLIPFKDTFTSFFFVSIGMLLDLHFVIDNFMLVALTVGLVLFIKTIIAGATGFVLGHTFRGTVMVGIALCQVGEFSFILAKFGIQQSLISERYYQLFLAVAVITMSVSPFLMMVSKPLASTLLKLPIPGFWVNGLFPLKEIPIPEQKEHLVIIGKDLRAVKLATMARFANMPYVSVIFDPALVKDRQKEGYNVVYGDAVNEPVLSKAYIQNAESVVISISDMIAAMAIVSKVRELNNHAKIFVRAHNNDYNEQLYKLGANEVVPEKFETAIDLFERVLTQRLLPRKDIINTIARIRSDYYGIFRDDKKNERSTMLDQMPNLDITAVKIDNESEVLNHTLTDIKLRKVTGATLLAIKRGDKIIEHPEPPEIFELNDVVYLMGKPDQISKAIELFSPSKK